MMIQMMMLMRMSMRMRMMLLRMTLLRMVMKVTMLPQDLWGHGAEPGETECFQHYNLKGTAQVMALPA